jgi:hypothetical protein
MRLDSLEVCLELENGDKLVFQLYGGNMLVSISSLHVYEIEPLAEVEQVNAPDFYQRALAWATEYDKMRQSWKKS